MVLPTRWARARRVVTTAALAAALTAAVSATPAAAATGNTGHLSTFTGGCTGTFIGLSLAGETSHAYSIARSFKVELWGADPVFDDFLASFVQPAVIVAPVTAGAGYIKQLCVSPNTLDEDDGTDDVYAKLFFYNSANATGPVVDSIKTNQIHANF